MSSVPAEAACRVCGSSSVTGIGVVEYIIGYEWPVYDCHVCGCRFSRHDGSVYDALHRVGAISYYKDYRDLASQAKLYFDRGDIGGLRSLLAIATKYRFVIDEVERTPSEARLLEIGCSRGYLTSYFIASGRNVLGVDVSDDAVAGARANFGDHFALADSDRTERDAPYDVIYHVGMIGCVADPVGLTRRLLSMLKPDGKLIFNAPNRTACRMRGQLWIDSAPPPDLVTIFPPGFWTKQLEGWADVREGIEWCDSDQSLARALRWPLRSWVPPTPRTSLAGSEDAGAPAKRSRLNWKAVTRGAARVISSLGLSRFAPRVPTEFGLFVKMRPTQGRRVSVASESA